jgi:hypothetical protein
MHGPTAVQIMGSAGVVVGVLLLAGLAWAFLAGGIAALAFGIVAEMVA